MEVNKTDKNYGHLDPEEKINLYIFYTHLYTYMYVHMYVEMYFECMYLK